MAVLAAATVWQGGVPRADAAPDFTLIDQDARTFRLSAWRGHPAVLFFGYTHCPDVCPTTLARIAKALSAHGVPPDTQVALVTVDPARDTPAVLKRYLRLFDPRFRGLTGSLPKLTSVYTAYHVRRKRSAEPDEAANYTVSHGTTTFYIARDGSVHGLGNWDDLPSDIARELGQLR